jgi:hypothetical protein
MKKKRRHCVLKNGELCIINDVRAVDDGENPTFEVLLLSLAGRGLTSVFMHSNGTPCFELPREKGYAIAYIYNEKEMDQIFGELFGEL